VGNGDILTVEHALEMLRTTSCDALMIGRGAVINPFIFHQIRAHFSKQPYTPCWDDLERYLNVFITDIEADMPTRGKVNKLKQLMGFLFKGNAALLEKREAILTSQFQTPAAFIEFALPLLKENFR